jgi:hypothetical protein
MRPAAALDGDVRNQPAVVLRPAVLGGGACNELAAMWRPAIFKEGWRNQPAAAPAIPGGALHGQPAPIPQASAVQVGDGAHNPLAAVSGKKVNCGIPFEVGSEPRSFSDGSFTPHFNAPPSRRRKLRTLPALKNFNPVHFKRPITTASEHNLFLELYMKHAIKCGTNYRALLMGFNAAVAKQIWGLLQRGHQQAIESDPYFKDF